MKKIRDLILAAVLIAVMVTQVSFAEEPSSITPPVEGTAVESSLDELSAEASSDEAAAETPSDESAVEAPSDEAAAETPTDESAVEAPSAEPAAETPSDESAVETLSTEPAGRSYASDEAASARSSNEEPRYVRTVMMYICGSNLETYSAMATYNIKQILQSNFSKNDAVKFIVLTGGSDIWQTPSEYLVDKDNRDKAITIDPEYNQIWEAKGADAAEDPGKLVLLEKEGLHGKKARDKNDEEFRGEVTSDPQVLKDFINYCAGNYPAEKYDLILWDHGSGPLGGFANDEAMFFSEMNFGEIMDAFSDNAVTKDGGKFDFINFDACLMSSVEFALAFADYMDYYIASAELIPGYGEYYTGWLNKLGEEPDYDTYKLGKMMVDDYIRFYEKEEGDGASQNGTLAVINMDKMVNYYGFANTLMNLPVYLKQQATEQNPEVNDFLFYDEFDSGKNSISYGGMHYYDLGTLVSQLSFDFKELTPDDILDDGTIIDANIYSEPLAALSYYLSQEDMIYARGTKGIKSKPLYYRDSYGKVNYNSVGTSGLYLTFPAADDPSETRRYFEALEPVVNKLEERVKALEAEAMALDENDPEAPDLDIQIRNTRSRLMFLNDYRYAVIDYSLIAKTGKIVSGMLDEGYKRSSINYESVREYMTGGAKYDPSVEDLEGVNTEYTICDWNNEIMPDILIRSGRDPDAPYSEHAAAEAASREWLSAVISQQAEENISRKEMTFMKTKENGFHIVMKNTQKRVVDDVRYNLTARIPAAENYINECQERGELSLMTDEEKEDLTNSKIGYVIGEPVIENADGTKVNTDSKLDLLKWYMEPGGIWDLPPTEESWYTVRDAKGYCHVANIETDEEAGEIYFYGNYKSENGIDTLCCLSFAKNGKLKEILLGTEDGNSYRRIPVSEMVGKVEVMPIRSATIFVDDVSIPLSQKPIIVSPKTVGSIRLVKKDLNDIEDLRSNGEKADIDYSVAVRDIYGYELKFYDNPPTAATSAFSRLRLRSAAQTGSSVTLKWKKVKGAKTYVIYGNKCGKKNKFKKIVKTTGTSRRISKVLGKKLRKGTYYKFKVVALDKYNREITVSKVVHVATKGGKVGNYKGVSVKKSVITKAKKLKKGKTLKLNAKAVKASKLTVRKHRGIRYASSNPEIATVNGKGVLKARKKGACYVYAYAQNGVYRKIRVVVK